MRKTARLFAAIAASAAVASASTAVAFADTTAPWLPPTDNNNTASWTGTGTGTGTASWVGTGTGSSASYSADITVWANGRDIKDDKKTPEDETQNIKTGKIQHIAMSAGGKWNAAITDTTVTTVSSFMERLDSKGKFIDAKTSENKLIASAKIKDGELTVTAGKQAGRVNVWVYETNKDGVVYIPAKNVMPQMYTVEVKMSAGSPTLAELDEVSAGVLKSGAKGVSKLDLGFDPAPGAMQAEKKLMIADKKVAADTASTYSITYKNSDKTETPSVVLAKFNTDKVTLTFTPVSVGKSTINIVNDQSGKAAKLTVEVKNMVSVNFDPKLIKVQDITVKDAPVNVSNGGKVIDGTQLKITQIEGADVDQITLAGKVIKSGAKIKASGQSVDILTGKVYPVTITGADKNSTVTLDGKAFKSGTSVPTGTKLSLKLEAGKAAMVKSGTANPLSYTGPITIEILVTGETSVTIGNEADINGTVQSTT